MSSADNAPILQNRPGLSAIAYRIGDYGSFNRRMQAHLSQQLRPEIPALSRLTTRDHDDAAIAFLDAWAVVADVLTFYQERIANEGYLRTATERLSIIELTRTIGYELHPGVAASTYLAFTVDDAPGNLKTTLIPQGTGIMSIPTNPDELPQTFETSEAFLAQVDWNALKPRSAKAQVITRIAESVEPVENSSGDTELTWKLQIDGEAKNGTRVYLYLQGIATQLKPGDFLLLMDSENANATGFLLKLETVEPNAAAGYTRVSWFKGQEHSLANPSAAVKGEILTYQSPQVFAFRQKASLFGYNAPEWKDYGFLVERDVFHIDLDLSHLQPDDPTKTQEQWKGSEPIGVFNADISCLALTDQYLVAGTVGNGIFRRALDNTETQWVAVNNGLINPVAGVASLQIRSLAVDNYNSLFVGTAGGGVFCSKNYGDTWIPVPIPKTETESTLNLLDKVVHSLTTYDQESNSYIFAGTDAGIFRYSKSVLRTGAWESKKSGLRVYSLLTIHTNIGTAIIDLVGNPFLESDVSYQYIRLRNISGSLSDQTSFRVKGRSIEILQINEDSLKIYAVLDDSNREDEIFFSSLNQGYIFAGTDNGIYCSGNAEQNWQEWGLQSESDPKKKAIYSLTTYENNGTCYIFAGSTGRIYRSTNLDNSWNSKSIGNSDNQVHSLQSNKKPEAGNHILFAGTTGGVYYSDDNGDNWNPINRDLPTKTITALLATPRAAQSRLYAGTSLSLLSERDEWLNFNIQAPNIDLDTLYPQVLPNSWAVLIDNNLVSAYQANSVREVEREDFGLTEKVTRIETDAALAELRDFINLRTTQVLIQSHCLALAPKPFTVTTRQHQIFSDPIQADEIFLSHYTAGLEPDQKLVVSGQRLRFEVNDIGGVAWADVKSLESVSWEPANTNLLNQLVQSFAVFEENGEEENSKCLFAGTEEGVFRLALPLKSEPADHEWQVVENNGLTNANIQALAVVSHTLTGASTEWRLVAGTSTGIFTRNASGREWHPANLKDRSVRVIVAFNSYLLAGTNNGLFRSEDAGQTWQFSGLSNIDIQALSVDSEPQQYLIYAGTANDGVFLWVQNGLGWKQVSETRALKASVRVKGRRVEGVPTALMSVLQKSKAAVASTPELSEAVTLEAPIPEAFQADSSAISGFPGFSFGYLLPKLSFINIVGRNLPVLKIIDATTIELAEAVSSDIPEETPASINNGLINQNVTALAVVRPTGRVLAGTAGSGIYYSDDSGQTWLPVPGQPTDLHIRCLFADESGIILAGTAMGGVFASQTHGADWKPLVPGLAITNSQPVAVLDVQAVAISDKTLFAGGLGRLRSDDNLEQVLLKAGDQLQLLERPVLATTSATATDPKALWRWRGRDRNGFEGYLLARQDQIMLRPAAAADAVVSELAVVQAPPTDQQDPRLKLAEPLKNCYDPATVKICANIVPATHGETIEQILGSGDALSPNQRFELSKPPLTYVSADNPRGAKSTLEMRVNDILWHEVERLYQLKERDEAYIVRLDADSNATLTFGDGEQGARLPTGQENIRAQYRHGLGIGGNLTAGSLSLLKTSPPGIKAVINPVPATGGANPEAEATAKEKAPPTVRTLGRIVSLQDFEDFAQSFSGIGKALVTPLQQGGTRMVHITVAGGEGAAIDPTSSLYENLVAAIDAARDPFQVVVQVDSYEKILFNVEAKVVVNPRYEPEKVLAQVRSDLLQHFAFKQRQFGQPVTASEVIAWIQRVDGIEATDLDRLYPQGKARLLEPTLTAALAQWDETTTQVSPAQLLLLNPQGLILTPVPAL
jgi:photosystem II stability/assembly factor-like uncharacterized protein